MTCRPFAGLVSWVVVLVGCGRGSPTQPMVGGAVGGEVAGVVSGAPPGTLVHLLRPAGSPTLEALAEAVEDSAEVDQEGRFRLERRGPGPQRVLVSAPGAALAWFDAEPSLALELTPEARARLVLRGPDGPEPLGVALVLDEAGTPLPLPCEELVSDEAGRLELGRLPAGNLSVVALSCDLTRVGRGALSVPAGGEVALELALVDDPSELARALVLFGETDLAALARGDEGAR